MSAAPSSQVRRFRVALSFPGERRAYVEAVAKQLAMELGKKRVLYDAWYEAEFARPNLNTTLATHYHQHSDLIVLFLCEDYARKEWCRLELRVVLDLIKQGKDEMVMPVRFDMAEIPGIYSIDGYVWAGNGRPAEEVADLILERLGEKTSRSLPSPPDPDPTRKIALALLIFALIAALFFFGITSVPGINQHIGGIFAQPVFSAQPVSYNPVDPGAKPDVFVGRQRELAELDAAWQSLSGPKPQRVAAIIAWGGFGKTTLVRQWLWLKEEKRDGWPGGTVPAGVFWWNFDRNDLDGFFQTAIHYFSGKPPAPESLQNDFAKREALRAALAGKPFVLVLDGLEAAQNHQLGDPFGRAESPLANLLQDLVAGRMGPGLTVITSRRALKDIENRKGDTLLEIALEERPLSDEEARSLLRKEGLTAASAEEYQAIIHWCGHHPLALKILAGLLKDHNGGTAERWKEMVQAESIVAPPGDGRAENKPLWKILHWYDKNLSSKELELMKTLALFREPVEEVWARKLLVTADWPVLEFHDNLDRLAGMRLLDHKGTRYDLHPLIREHYRALFDDNQRKALHDKLYRLYAETIQPEHRPDGLDGLRPLYEAVHHGCRAGRYQETLDKIYKERILRGDEFYSTYKLGAFGAELDAVREFFASPWEQVHTELTESDQAWLFNEAAFDLRALGLLAESVEPMRAGLEMYVKQKNWRWAAIVAGNLSELELTLGRIEPATADADHSVKYADLSGDAFQRMTNRTTLADTLHQQGQREEARKLFEEAEIMQQQRQPKYRLLYSVQGFRYDDLLLAEAERAAWRVFLGTAGAQLGEKNRLDVPLEVAERAKETLKIAERNNWLLDMGLDHLTLGRAALYRALLETTPIEPARRELDAAVEGLQKASQLWFVPPALLTRAWLNKLENHPEAAQADLNEAQQIAERGGMKLHLADIYLHRARLFHDRDALAQARKLIEEIGYGRRREELADAEHALNLP